MNMKRMWRAGQKLVILCVISCFVLCGCEKENAKYLGIGRGSEDFSFRTPPVLTAVYVVNTSSRRIHLPDCRYAQSMSEAHRKELSDLAQALREGYTYCGHCHPNVDTKNEDTEHEK